MERFWDGRREGEVDLVRSEVPFMGECPKDRPMLEEWRKFSNAYYRRYNDGDGFKGKLRFMAKRFDVHLHNERDLEELGDKVLDAALAEREALKCSHD
mgnify:CR=1 FL=1